MSTLLRRQYHTLVCDDRMPVPGGTADACMQDVSLLLMGPRHAIGTCFARQRVFRGGMLSLNTLQKTHCLAGSSDVATWQLQRTCHAVPFRTSMLAKE